MLSERVPPVPRARAFTHTQRSLGHLEAHRRISIKGRQPRAPSASPRHRAFIAAGMPQAPQCTSLKHCIFQADADESLFAPGAWEAQAVGPIDRPGPGLQHQGHYPALLGPRAPLSSGARCECSWPLAHSNAPMGRSLRGARPAQITRGRKDTWCPCTEYVSRGWRCNGAEEAHGLLQIAALRKGSINKFVPHGPGIHELHFVRHFMIQLHQT